VTSRHWGALFVLGALEAALLWWGSGGGHTAPSRQLAAVLASAALGSALLIAVARVARLEARPATVLLLGLVLRLIAAQAWPLLEDDHYRHLWDGWRTATTLDPYRLAPSAWFGDATLAAPWSDVLNGINHPDVPTLYGPLLQAAFALAYAIAPARVGALQALWLATDMAVLCLLVRHARDLRPVLLYALHPLLLKEALASAHHDGLLGLLLLLALLAWQRKAAAWMGVALGLALATKVAALVAWPLLLWPAAQRGWRWSACAGSTAVLTAALAYLPFWIVGGSDVAGLATFGSTWRFNPLLFRVLDESLPAGWARPVAGIVVLLGVAALLHHWQRNAPARLPPVDLALAWLLLWSPVVNPWYWLWLLPAAALLGRTWLVVCSSVGVLAYLNGSVLDHGAAFAVPWAVTAVQLLVLLGGAAMAVQGTRITLADAQRP
jgi:alpha-1,6-mannosyltransferase